MIPPYQPPFGNFNENNRGSSNTSGAPATPPPSTIPARPMTARGGATIFAVDPESIRHCIRRFTYVWLDNGQNFWLFPIQVGRRSVSGFRWMPRFGWVFTGISLDRIDFFTCV